MSYWLSKPYEALPADDTDLEADVIVVGSGYGAAFATLALLDKYPDAKIWVLERGNEYVPGDFPRHIGDVPGHVAGVAFGESHGQPDALFEFHVGDGVAALVGSGVGGTSLINANVALRPDDAVINAWPAPLDGESWATLLKNSFKYVEDTLGIATFPGNRHSTRYAALKTFGNRLDRHCVTAEVPLTVSFSQGPNAQGVTQEKCNQCGNCITGCNIGAKSSLNLNAWPAAIEQGVALYSGVTVRHITGIENGSHPWALRIRPTKGHAPERAVRARVVVLAAGTFGSTEILLRSGKLVENPLSTSQQLGAGLALNGDSVIANVGRKTPVGTLADEPSSAEYTADAGRALGPTILGCASVSDGTHRYLFEDAGVPFAMRRVFNEIITTFGALHRVPHRRRSAWHRAHPDHDHLAPSDDLSDHTQLLLVMGRDDARGTIDLGAVSGRIAISYPGMNDGFYAGLDKLLRRDRSLEGDGEYLPNPLMYPLPTELLAPDKGLRSKFTVHPLGGCAMATDSTAGVVDTRGCVYTGNDHASCHEGLYVLDGSIIPGSLGTNPLLAISALAHHLASRIPLQPSGGRQKSELPSRPPGRYGPVDISAAAAHASASDMTVAAVFKERLSVPLDPPKRRGVEQWLALPQNRLNCFQALILDIEITISDMYAWLSKPDSGLPARLMISGDPANSGGTRPTAHLQAIASAATGSVTLGARSPATLWNAISRLLGLRRLIKRLYGGSTGTRFSRCTKWHIARMLIEHRAMNYSFEWPLANGQAARFKGTKVLAATDSAPNPWTALTSLECELDRSGSSGVQRLTFDVDLVRLSRGPAPLQVTQAPHTPEAVAAAVSALAFFVRALAQTHCVHFVPPDYTKFGTVDEENAARLAAPPNKLNYFSGTTAQVSTSVAIATSDTVDARLIRYQPTHGEAPWPPVLVVHGLAMGSEFFLTSSIQTNLIQHLLASGYDCWLLDYSTSANFIDYVDQDICIDTLAVGDIPWAVRHVYDQINAERHLEGTDRIGIGVIAHCMGAAALAAAVLGGRLNRPRRERTYGKTSMISALATHAITPWVESSWQNRVRANVLSVLKDLPLFSSLLAVIDPIPNRDPSPVEIALDALGSSLPWREEDWTRHGSSWRDRHTQTLCNRMTVIYGRDWKHAQLAQATHDALARINGPAPLEILLQFHYCTLRRRLTDLDGRINYLTRRAFRARWTFPTLFLHGDENEVIDCESSRLSAHLLAKVRWLYSNPPEGSEFDDVTDYHPFCVGLKLFESYGHMDVFFGANAHNDVYPHVTHFLADPAPAQAQAHHKFPQDSSRRPRGHTYPFLLPMAGPIVTLPSDRGPLRVACDFDEFVTHQPGRFELVARGAPNPITSSPAPALRPFRAADIALDHVPNGPFRARLQFSSAGIWNNRILSSANRLMAPRWSPSTNELDIDWSRMPWFKRLRNERDADRSLLLSFAVGSCLYPGTSVEQEYSDRIFEGLRLHAEGKAGAAHGLDHLLLLGDQIYADSTANIFDPGNTDERYRARYRRAFGGMGFRNEMGLYARQVLSHLPAHFAIDDHEIDDNWPAGSKLSPPDVEAALDWAFRYQMPLLAVRGQARRYFYPYSSRDVPFFVFDTRGERAPVNPHGARAALMTDVQWNTFKNWAQSLDEPLAFLASGSPIAPLARHVIAFPQTATRGDNLLAYPGFLHDVVAILSQSKVNKWVWLVGDPHFSAFSELTLETGEQKISLVQICASGLCAPVPFANVLPGEYTFGLPQQLALGSGATQVTVHSTDTLLTAAPRHFIRVDVTPADAACRSRMIVTAFDHDGTAIAGALKNFDL